MDAANYVTLTRQSGLLREMQVVANNIANAATTGFRQEGLIFSEYVRRTEAGPSLSMANANLGHTSQAQGALTKTGGRLDLAIEGAGFFLIETPFGERLTRAGSFALSPDGDLVTPDGYRVLDVGSAPIFVPPDSQGLSVSSDGTLGANGRPLGQLAVVEPVDFSTLTRADGVLFHSPDGFDPAPQARVLQGFLEGSNVDPILQVARMIEVQRAYEMGQKFLDTEDDRIRSAIKTVTR